MYIIDVETLQQLFASLQRRGYSLVGPTIRDGAIVFDGITSVTDLPKGWMDEQGAASYSLRKRDDGAYFGFVIGPVSWKKFLFPPKVKLFSAVKTGKGFHVTPPALDENFVPQKFAFIGIRSCELNALALHDKVFTSGEYADPTYRGIRENACLISVDCTATGGNCFCASMGTGPAADRGFDLALTEVIAAGVHFFAVRPGSALGNELIAELPHREAGADDEEMIGAAVASAAARMGRAVELDGIREILYENFEHAEWDEVSKRCLTCANCTMVCPTCFCSTVEDTTDLSGDKAERWRRWDSCHTMDFARVAGGNIRPSTRARYRQWVMHKFAYWQDQFGSAGCVGCGRCITWCPVGIDITAELRTIRENSISFSSPKA